mmetsp:Transcript_6962/g.26039  ORF Transcript_6962/g.26039 Transcript_6962/m.26039 type:complete len:124 (+) Transcript_6962:526-897(+)
MRPIIWNGNGNEDERGNGVSAASSPSDASGSVWRSQFWRSGIIVAICTWRVKCEIQQQSIANWFAGNAWIAIPEEESVSYTIASAAWEVHFQLTKLISSFTNTLSYFRGPIIVFYFYQCQLET